MNLNNEEREPSDEEDGIPPEIRYDFNIIAMDESDESLRGNEDNMGLKSSTSDSEAVYSHSLSGVPFPSAALETLKKWWNSVNQGPRTIL